jgi:coenzyme F420-reducing hydrogenase beta subunit
MTEDAEGFRYPSIDRDVCTSCGACERVCPAMHARARLECGPKPEVYAAWSRSASIRSVSSSGGIFSSLASEVLARGGAVGGAAFDEANELRHVLVREERELTALRGSKYVQSEVAGAFREVRHWLRGGRSALFVGTPCQVDGLKAYLGKPRERLYTCDLVCHGVPSSSIFRAYRKWLEGIHRGQIRSLAFRDKAKGGWKEFQVVARFDDGQEYRRAFGQDAFMIGFLRNLYLRPACHACPYACLPRVGDITLGDFWGIGVSRPELDDDRGTSLVLVNSEPGASMLTWASAHMHVYRGSLDVAVGGNRCLQRPTAASPLRRAFFEKAAHSEFADLERKYLRPRKAWAGVVRRSVGRISRVLGLRPAR